MVSTSSTSATPSARHQSPRHSRGGGASGAKADVSRPQFQPGKITSIHPKDYAIRFAFGGTISVLAALIGQWVNTRFGGIFTAFPAILLASLTLIGEEDGREQSAEDAEGGVLGALAFIAAATFIALTVTRISGAASLFLSLALWIVLAVGLYLVCLRCGLLHTYESKDQQNDNQQPAGDNDGNSRQPQDAKSG